MQNLTGKEARALRYYVNAWMEWYDSIKMQENPLHELYVTSLILRFVLSRMRAVAQSNAKGQTDGITMMRFHTAASGL